ncbi:MAG TPA: hypothetical protein VMK12_17765 [Anaeromyxobacteraceae bacterium]|nr:hypothetical protein [Anaeromyxobacteraceae bacterium]
MDIVVTHLTRMSRGYVCVAGEEERSGRNIRPVAGQLSTSVLARHGGAFDIGNRIDLGPVVPVPTPPEVEDHRFELAKVRRLGTLKGTEFWSLLSAHSKRKFTDVFGPDLQVHRGAKGYVELHQGSASLGYLTPVTRPTLTLSSYGSKVKITLELSDGTYRLEMPVTDIRLYGPDHVTPDAALVASVNKRLATTNCIVAVGLARPFAGALDRDVHWMQANNLHLQDDPVWQLG